MSDELALYHDDRPAWIAMHAPCVAATLADPAADDDIIRLAWEVMRRDYKAAVWALLDEAGRERVRRVRAAA